MRSIRLRVALGVLGVVVVFGLMQNAYVLNRFERGLREETDSRLLEELDEVSEAFAGGVLDEFIAEHREPDTRSDEYFIEVLDATGAVIARSDNVPAAGMPGATPFVELLEQRVFEVPHPRSRSGARHIRGIEARRDGAVVRFAIALDDVQRWYWNLRRNVVTSLGVIALLGTIAAYVLAARALRPLGNIAARAAALGSLPDGDLPRTRSGDEVDRLAAVLNDLLRRIRAEMGRMRRLTADAGHALRTPLTALRGHLELQAARATGADADALGALVEQVDEMTGLVNRLLLLEKLEGGRADVRAPERFDLLELARELVEHLRVLAVERGIALECQGEPVTLFADRAQIRQAIVNLVDNALRHTPHGGKVTVDVHALGTRARLSVADSGPGLAPSELERVFERFYSSATSGSAGTGLGLPIARAIARAHGGEVGVSSPGGALFVLDLPAAA